MPRSVSKKANNRKLPDEIIPFHSSDKRLEEVWYEGRNPGNIPSPFRALLLGPPHSGKTCLAKNLILKQDPPFAEIYIIHEDAGQDDNECHTSEWDDIDPTLIMGDAPSLGFWNAIIMKDDPDKPPVKRLVIVDDLELRGVGKERLRNISTLMRYCSSHKGFSVIINYQNFFGLEPCIKKFSNLFLVWRPHARNEIALIENRVGLPKDTLKELFKMSKQDPHTFITIDLTKRSPYPLRMGLWDMVDIEEQ